MMPTSHNIVSVGLEKKGIIVKVDIIQNPSALEFRSYKIQRGKTVLEEAPLDVYTCYDLEHALRPY